jgi:large subunit ribosomal protein L13
MMQTTFPTIENAKRDWYAVSAKNQVLGKLAARVAVALMGKRKPSFVRDVDQGDFVVVTDVEKLVVTGNKGEGKIYKFHTGFVGGLQEYSFNLMQAQRPDEVLKLAVKRMLPKNQQARAMLGRLKLFKGPAHTFGGQNPAPL